MVKGKIFEVIIVFVISIFGYKLPDSKSRHLFNHPFDPDKSFITKKILIDFRDTIPDDTLTIYYSAPNHPNAVSRNIHTAVCIDTLCRLVDITIFWEITGKYLGFTLPTGEELTKKKHTPFTEGDYIRLNEILGDSLSQLGLYSAQDIHPPKQTNVKTDGISGATIPDLTPWIVPEAAYTSHTLWHLTYGASRDSILAYTFNHFLSNRFLTELLNSGDAYSQVKALQWIGKDSLTGKQFIIPVISILHNGNFAACRQALKFLQMNMDNNKLLQYEVVQLFDNEDFRIKNTAIEYFRTVSGLDPSVAKEMIRRAHSDNFYIVNVLLSIIEKKYEPDFEDQRALSVLLESKNGSLANRVFVYLSKLSKRSPEVVKKLKQYATSM